MHPVDYCNRIFKGQHRAKERILMARVALHILSDSHAYDVDLSELNDLSSENYVVTRSILTYCTIFPEHYGALLEKDLDRLREIVGIHSPNSLDMECTQ